MDPLELPPGQVFRLGDGAGFAVLVGDAGRFGVVFAQEADEGVLGAVGRLAGALPVVVVCGRASPRQVERLLAAGAWVCLALGAGLGPLLDGLGLGAAEAGPPADGAVRLGDCGLVIGGREFRLTPAEYRIVQVLWAAGGRTVAHAELERAVHGRSGVAERGAVRQAVYRLRARLGPLGQVVETVPGFGYRLRRELPPGGESLPVCDGPVIAS